jgi:hypothetical protein
MGSGGVVFQGAFSVVAAGDGARIDARPARSEPDIREDQTSFRMSRAGAFAGFSAIDSKHEVRT